MTGFGKATASADSKKYTVEIKSLNSKQLDLTVRIPSAYRHCELDLRRLAAEQLLRGKADMIVSVENTGAAVSGHLNLPALQAYKAQLQDMARELDIPEPADWYSVLLRFADTMTNEADADAAVTEDDAKALASAAVEALEALTAHRRSEGRKLEEFFTKRINAISELLGQVTPFEHERIERIRTRLEENLAKLPGVEVDKGRLEQEMIFYIEKLDINEEKQRLAQHLSYFIETMSTPEPGQGKKLGFIAQEMGREINTLGSKSNHAQMQRITVMMKDELEQIKEQVLNVL